MADISKCDGEKCKLKNSCYRYTAAADPHYQSYIIPDKQGKECNMYWETDKAQGMTIQKALKDINETLEVKVQEFNDLYPNVWYKTLVVCKEALEKYEKHAIQSNGICDYCKNCVIDGCTKDCDDYSWFEGRKMIEVEE